MSISLPPQCQGAVLIKSEFLQTFHTESGLRLGLTVAQVAWSFVDSSDPLTSDHQVAETYRQVPLSLAQTSSLLIFIVLFKTGLTGSKRLSELETAPFCLGVTDVYSSSS